MVLLNKKIFLWFIINTIDFNVYIFLKLWFAYRVAKFSKSTQLYTSVSFPEICVWWAVSTLLSTIWEAGGHCMVHGHWSWSLQSSISVHGLNVSSFLVHEYTYKKSRLLLCSDNVANNVRSVPELTSACLHQHEVYILMCQLMSLQSFITLFPACQ